MPRARELPPVRSFGDSYIGRRKNNEDCLGKHEPSDLALRAKRGCLYIVSDGMGGHASGEIASLMAVETVLTRYYADRADPETSLVDAIQEANERIHTAAREDIEKEGMGCTIVACIVAGGSAIIAHVGDSRAYRLRSGKLSLLTRDHLHLIENLDIGEEEAHHHHLRHRLSRALGAEPEVQVDATILPWEDDDRFLLCSDGLSDVVPESEILAALSEATPREAVTRLLQQARFHEAKDNSSAIVLHLIPEEASPLHNTPLTDNRPAMGEDSEAFHRDTDPMPRTDPEMPVDTDEQAGAEGETASSSDNKAETHPADRPGRWRRWFRFRGRPRKKSLSRS
ncbi:MAG: protein phosphatase 2C domain-containing protein [Blastocatellia bacterium]|nr:protein phosphatase 2C domain-containing protein [Blastocatellia bacterium]